MRFLENRRMEGGKRIRERRRKRREAEEVDGRFKVKGGEDFGVI